MSFTKLDSSLTASSIWNEPDPVRIVWVTMMSMADRDGNVKASVVGLAHLARKGLTETQNALAVLEAPDIHSGRKDLEGRRIIRIEGGWHLVTHAYYREIGMSEQQKDRTREKTRERVKRYRALQTVTPASASASGDASDIYDAYPRKVGRPKAIAEITKALKKTPFPDLLAKTQAFAKAQIGADPQFIPHPATWFHQERFNDDPSTWQRNVNGKTPARREKIDVPITRR